MQKRVIYTIEGGNTHNNNISVINESVERMMKKIGALVVNSAYILTDGSPSEAYGYYMFPRMGLITTTLTCEDSEYNLSVNFFGFEGHKENYNKIKIYIEDILNKVLY